MPIIPSLGDEIADELWKVVQELKEKDGVSEASSPI